MSNDIKKIFFAGLVCCCATATLTACSDDDPKGDPDKDWAGTANSFVPTDEKGFSTYYSPAIGRCGDPMPFYDQKAGDFKVLYLQEFDNNADKRFHPIWGVATTDGANYRSLGEVLPFGETDYQQDAALGTGCAYYCDKDNKYYIYYTGHNGNCTNREVVMRATSDDFKTWTKDPLWELNGPQYGYSGNDFRDPQIFVAEDGLYRMLIATYQPGGKPLFAEFKSSDMRNWEHVGSFKMVWNDRMCECPDVFKMGDWWYLVFSEAPVYSRQVKYVMAKSWEELKTRLDPPAWPDGSEDFAKLDSRAFYAGKTASNGTDRYIWGWCPIRDNYKTDIYKANTSVSGDKEPAWGGALVCHRIVQHSDGKLSLGEVPGIKAKYNQAQSVSVMSSSGWANGKLSGDDAYVLYNRLGSHNHLSLTVTTSNKWDKFGISVVRGTDSDRYYTMVVNPESESSRKINFEEEGKGGKGFIGGIDGYFFPTPEDNTYHIDIYTDNSVLVMYINDNVCYTQRIYGIQKNCWSVNNYGGSITVSDVKVSQY